MNKIISQYDEDWSRAHNEFNIAKVKAKNMNKRLEDFSYFCVDYNLYSTKCQDWIIGQGFNCVEALIIYDYLYDKYHSSFIDVLENTEDLVSLIKRLRGIK